VDDRRASRADAVRNRRRVERAASEVFAERGMGASVADVAARAGVGNATVYRNYPTKTELLAEVAIRWLTGMEEVARRFEAGADPVAAFRGLIEAIFQRLREDRLAADLLRAGNITGDVAAARRRVEARTTAVLRRAARAGAVADDVTYADLSVLVLGTAQRLTDMGESEPAAWQRMAGFVLSAVAPRGR
jgi:AcrR family transcriptional regulator